MFFGFLNSLWYQTWNWQKIEEKHANIFHGMQDPQIKGLCLCAYLCMWGCRMRILIMFASMCVRINSMFAWHHANICICLSVCQCTDMCVFVLLHISIKMKDNLLNEQRFPFVEAHYPCTLPLLSLTRAWGQLHSQAIPLQSYPRICAINMHWLLFLIMQFILSTCCLHPNFLPYTLIPLYF